MLGIRILKNTLYSLNSPANQETTRANICSAHHLKNKQSSPTSSSPEKYRF